MRGIEIFNFKKFKKNIRFFSLKLKSQRFLRQCFSSFTNIL